MPSRSLPTKACHNCRRKRLKCDRSEPQCHKCIRAGQECLGYGGLFRWNNGVASRGKMTGRSFEEGRQKGRDYVSPKTTSTRKHAVAIHDSLYTPNKFIPPIHNSLELSRVSGNGLHYVEPVATPSFSLPDPLFQGLAQDSRCYIQYFAEYVCKDLVCYDVPNDNPFRNLIPLTRGHPALFHVIIAISALHMFNSSQRSSRKCPSVQPFSGSRSSKVYNQALMSKQTALGLLRQSLRDTKTAGLEVVLASIALFIEFELVDSGRDGWRCHVNAAKGLTDSLQSASALRRGNLDGMSSFLISNCAVYDVLGSTLISSTPRKYTSTSSFQLISALKSAESNNYLSCPALLLQLMLKAAELSHSTTLPETTASQISLLLLTARSFDAVVWANELQTSSPHKDAQKRIHIASAHKAAVCIYISRASSLFSQTIEQGEHLESLVADVIHHLSFVTADDGLFKATSWPAFIAGVETKDQGNQEWAVNRLYELWDFCPWGYIQSAIEILNMVWGKRNALSGESGDGMNWIQELRSLGVDWLIA